jgi:hypothetical protein
MASLAAGARVLPYTLTRFFDGDVKTNFPTGFKTTALLATVVLLFLLASSHGGDRAAVRTWRSLGFVVAFAFVDESVYLHQSLQLFLHQHYPTDGVLTYAWTAVYVPALVIAAGFVLPGLRWIEAPTRWQVLAGGVIYALGAVAMEPIKSQIASTKGDGGLAFKITAAVSDSLEMFALTLLVVVLLRALVRRSSRLVLHGVIGQ